MKRNKTLNPHTKRNDLCLGHFGLFLKTHTPFTKKNNKTTPFYLKKHNWERRREEKAIAQELETNQSDYKDQRQTIIICTST